MQSLSLRDLTNALLSDSSLRSGKLYALTRLLVLTARGGFYQSLPLPVHGDLHVLQLMVPQQFQDCEYRQANPDRQAAPGAELSGTELNVEPRRVDAVGLVDVIASRQLARWESLGHTLTPGHEA